MPWIASLSFLYLSILSATRGQLSSSQARRKVILSGSYFSLVALEASGFSGCVVSAVIACLEHSSNGGPHLLTTAFLTHSILQVESQHCLGIHRRMFLQALSRCRLMPVEYCSAKHPVMDTQTNFLFLQYALLIKRISAVGGRRVTWLLFFIYFLCEIVFPESCECWQIFCTFVSTLALVV